MVVGGCDDGHRLHGLLRPTGRADESRGEHAEDPQPCRLYPMLLLSVAGAWLAARLLQIRPLPCPGCCRSTRRAEGIRYGTSRGHEIRVWDSTSEMRFLVLPVRPEGTEGWSEEELTALVTRNAMIGVETAKSPNDLGRK